MKSKFKKPRATQIVYELIPLRKWDYLYLFLVFTLLLTALSACPINLSTPRHIDDDLDRNFSKLETVNIFEIDIISLGTSSSKEAYKLEDTLTRDFFKITKKQVGFLDLSSNGQTFVESYEYLKYVNLTEKHIVILNLSPISFARPPLQNRVFKKMHKEAIPFKKRKTERLKNVIKLREKMYRKIKRTLTQYARKFYDISELPRYQFAGLQSGNPIKIEENRKRKYHRHLKNFPQYKHSNLDQLHSVIKSVQKFGAQVYLLEQPRMQNETLFSPWEKEYNKMLSDLSDQYSIKYVNLNTKAFLYPHDFVDVAHVSGSGRNKWSAEFIDWLISIKNKDQF